MTTGAMAQFGFDKLTAALQGLSMKQVMRMNLLAGYEMETLVTSVVEEDTPDSVFDLPTGLKEIPMPTPDWRLTVMSDLSRAAAWALVTEHVQSESLRKHLCRGGRGAWYARAAGEDEEAWGFVALVTTSTTKISRPRESSVPRMRDAGGPGIPRVGDPGHPLARRLQWGDA